MQFKGIHIFPGSMRSWLIAFVMLIQAAITVLYGILFMENEFWQRKIESQLCSALELDRRYDQAMEKEWGSKWLNIKNSR